MSNYAMSCYVESTCRRLDVDAAESTSTTRLVAMVSVFEDGSPSKYWIPNAMQDNSWQLWLASMMYLCTSLLALVEAIRAGLSKRGFNTFRFHFLTASFLFGALRGILTLVNITTWPQQLFCLYLFGFFLPQFLQFWTFSLLVLFVIRVVMLMNGQESAVETTLYPMYRFLLIFLLGLCNLVSYLLARSFDASTPDAASKWDQSAVVWNACLYFLLAVIGGYYCHRCYALFTAVLDSEQQQYKNRRAYFVVIIVFFIIFSLRFIWCFTYVFNSNPLQSIIERWMRDDEENKFNSAFLGFYFLFEILPTFLVVAFFRSSSSEDTSPGGASVAAASSAFGVMAVTSATTSTASTAPNTPRRAARALLGEQALTDPTMFSPPSSFPASPVTPLLHAAHTPSRSGRWNEAAHSLLPQLNAAAQQSQDDAMETLDLSHYDLK